MTDLDETRRLVMTAEYRKDALSDPVLYGTVLHAIVKHSRLVTDERRADEMLTRWWRSGSELDALERFVRILDRELARLPLLPDMASLDLDLTEDPRRRNP